MARFPSHYAHRHDGSIERVFTVLTVLSDQAGKSL
jgi:hypothetical protein